MNLEGVGIPDAPIVGQINGKEVVLGVVRASRASGHAEATSGLSFNISGHMLTVSLPPKPVANSREKWEILKPSTKKEDYRNLMVGITGKAHYFHSFVIRLELDTPVYGTLPGRIYLCLPDDEKSFIAGKFEAKLK